ncbi:hypothetical protein MA20_38780 [Bradyrhizobium japonicum]|uniref:Uncharacterized protein n=1 Tax=Bradyrhizobium japonicum TaxID=375 RepID=A0A0A3XN15_BRAJP|nr:hypothetical protein MA20_38780 [Bradyrhizobium japonicum]
MDGPCFKCATPRPIPTVIFILRIGVDLLLEPRGDILDAREYPAHCLDGFGLARDELVVFAVPDAMPHR